MINWLKKVFNIDNPYIFYDTNSDRLVEVFANDSEFDSVANTKNYMCLGRLRG